MCGTTGATRNTVKFNLGSAESNSVFVDDIAHRDRAIRFVLLAPRHKVQREPDSVASIRELKTDLPQNYASEDAIWI